LIETRHGSGDRSTIVCIEFDLHAEAKSSQLREAFGRLHEPQPLNNALVQFEEFVFRQVRDVDHGTRRSIAAVQFPMNRSRRSLAIFADDVGDRMVANAGRIERPSRRRPES
jgi:hypothetical protein